MRTQVRAVLLSLAGVVSLAGCGGDDNGGGQTPPPPPPPTTQAFEPFVQQQIQQSSCDTLEPASTTATPFTFANDQDTAEPRDVSAVTPGCTQK
jgi:hypothetical protein